MTGNPEFPGGGRAPADPRRAAPEVDRPRSGPVAELALVAAGLGLVVYLLGFVADVGLDQFTGPLLLGGGLLAGAVAVPTVRASVLVPSAVATVTGALFLLQAVVGGADSTVAIGALVLALLEAAAACGAALLHAGVLRAPRPRVKKPSAPPFAGYPQPPAHPQFPGQQYPGQPYPGSYAGHPGEPYSGDQYAGEHAYAQYARYGSPYGVPGYPPPPPYAAPGFDPSVHAAGGQPTYERPGTPPPAAPAPDQQTTVTASGGQRFATPAPTGGPGALDTGGSAVQSTGAHRADPDTGAQPVVPDAPAAPSDAGSERDDDRTRTIPTVSDER